MEELERLRQLAAQLDECRAQEAQLKSAVKETKQYQSMQETDRETKMEKSYRWGVFCIAELIFAVLINKGVSFVLTLSVNKGMAQKQYFAAGGVGYRTITIHPLVGVVLAIPIAFLVLFLVKCFLKHRDKKANARSMQQNQKNRENNNLIWEQNERIQNQNRQIAERLEAVQQKKQTIIQQLQAENPTFPVEYLAVSVMDFVQWELETGQAKNINQAIVHYEANKSRN